MTSKWRWLLLQLTRQLWFRAALLGLLGVATALVSVWAERFVPWELPRTLGTGAVERVLDILASSMLAVTTFSLSVMVAAYAAATSNASPRATRLLMHDATTQNVLATFIGSFLFGLVGIVTLSAGAYGERGRGILFLVTLVVIAIVVVTILRWIDHLSRLGRVGETTDRVEAATAAALTERARYPCLGARRLEPDAAAPPSAAIIRAAAVGYVQHVDVAALSALAERRDCEIQVTVVPGSFVHPAAPLARLVGGEPPDEACEAAARTAFSVGDERSFDQDPRFGLVVLGEIASRALSPAVNDPGTAIDVVGRAVRVLWGWTQRAADPPEEIAHPRISLPPLSVDDLFDDVFTPIARDGAGLIEVQMRLQKGLAALAAAGDERMAAAARRHSDLALQRAGAALGFEPDRLRLREAAEAAGLRRPAHLVGR